MFLSLGKSKDLKANAAKTIVERKYSSFEMFSLGFYSSLLENEVEHEHEVLKTVQILINAALSAIA